MRLGKLKFLVTVPLASMAMYGGVASTGTATITAHAVKYDQLKPIQKRILSGLGTAELTGEYNNQGQAQGRGPSNYYPTSDDGCPQSLGGGSRGDGNGETSSEKGGGRNVKVNQNCLNLTDPDLHGRGQAQNETAISQDPYNPNHLVATYNDYRRGDGNCWGSFSLDNGKTWTDTTIPMGFTRGQVNNVVDYGAAREYWQAGGDTSTAWDTKGNAYMSCQVFGRGNTPPAVVSNNPDQSSALLVFRSTHNNGASWNFPGRYAKAANDVNGTGAPFLDKQYLTVDNWRGSPYQDRVYVAWTEFDADGSAFIYESYSSDYGEHFSPPHLVSANAPVLCTNTYGAGTTAITGEKSNCNENQFANPFVGPDGNLYIVYQNFNNPVGHPVGDSGNGEEPNGGGTNAANTAGPVDNRNQILLSKSIDGGDTFTPPIKVADYYDLPDCSTYQGGQDAGRACVPEKSASQRSIFRATNYPTGNVNPRNPSEVVVTYGSYINRHSNEKNGCVPAGTHPAFGTNLYTGVKTPGACNNDILVSVSENHGGTFTGTTKDPRVMPTVTNQKAQATTDQWWQWQDWSRDSGKLAVSYYDRQYGTDETTGYMDVSLSGTQDIPCAADVAHADRNCFGTIRATTSSMPPPTEFANSKGNGQFFGDYSGLTALRSDTAHPLWMDTRNPALFLCPGTAASASRTNNSPAVPPQVCGGREEDKNGNHDGEDQGANPAPNGQRNLNDQDIFTASLRIPSRGEGGDEGGDNNNQR